MNPVNFIEINQITTDKDKNLTTKIDTISTSEIIEYRGWHKNKDQEAAFPGKEITVIYLRALSAGGESRKILMLESRESFAQRLGNAKVIRL